MITAKPYRQTILMQRLCHGVAFLLNEERKPQCLVRAQVGLRGPRRWHGNF